MNDYHDYLETQELTNLTWTLRDGTLTISGEGDMDDFDFHVIEDGYHTETFCTAPWWKKGAYKLIKTIVIQDGVTSIGELAFFKCNNVTEVVIPKSFTKIRAGAFADCGNLSTIRLPDGLKILGASDTEGDNLSSYGVFEMCDSLTGVTIPAGVVTIGENAFFRMR